MAFKILTRIITLSLLASSVLLASCGAGSIKNPFVPTRVVVFGDAYSDLTTNAQYTVNGDGSVNNWASQLAADYGVTNIVSYAKGNARLTNATGAGGVAVTSVTQQLSNFLAVDSFKTGDLVLINAGFSDLINEAATTNLVANATNYGNVYANLVRSMVAAGALHVGAANVYDLSRTPAAAIQTNLATLNGNSRSALVAAFNDQFKSNLGSSTATYVGDNVRLLDLEYYMDLVIAAPTVYAYVDATTVVCNSVDTTNGIGLGTNQVNSSLCTASTINSSATATTYNALAYNNYVFADAVYPTPAAHRSFGTYAYGLTVARW